MSDNLASLSLLEMLKGIESGAFLALDVISDCFEHVERQEPEVMAWKCRLTWEQYLAEYLQNKAFYQTSPLKGLPLGVKDIIDTADFPTEMGSPIHYGRQPVDDASCVAALKRAGAIVLGKTVTTEFAYFQAGVTRNPADPKRTPGGSSSGSAAAVAANMVPMALGSQTAASVIRPAAFCGTVGYVGTRGEYSLRGGQPLAQSLDSLGVFARDPGDINLLRSLLLQQPPVNGGDSRRPQKPVRMMVCSGVCLGDVSDDMSAALELQAQKAAAAGVDIVAMPQSLAVQVGALVEHHICIMAWEVCRNLVVEAQQPEKLSPAMRGLIESGLSMSRQDYLASLQQVDVVYRTMLTVFEDYDAILTPAAPGVAPLAEVGTGAPHMSRAWQALGLPVVSLVGSVDSQALPLGLQLVGRPRFDDLLLGHAAWMQDHCPAQQEI